MFKLRPPLKTQPRFFLCYLPFFPPHWLYVSRLSIDTSNILSGPSSQPALPWTRVRCNKLNVKSKKPLQSGSCCAFTPLSSSLFLPPSPFSFSFSLSFSLSLPLSPLFFSSSFFFFFIPPLLFSPLPSSLSLLSSFFLFPLSFFSLFLLSFFSPYSSYLFLLSPFSFSFSLFLFLSFFLLSFSFFFSFFPSLFSHTRLKRIKQQH